MAIDVYIYNAIKKRTHKSLLAKSHIVISALLLTFIVVGISLPRSSGSETSILHIMWILYSYLSLYIPKFVFVIFDMLATIPKLWGKMRINYLSWTGTILGVLIFVLMWWGTINRTNININIADKIVGNKDI